MKIAEEELRGPLAGGEEESRCMCTGEVAVLASSSNREVNARAGDRGELCALAFPPPISSRRAERGEAKREVELAYGEGGVTDIMRPFSLGGGEGVAVTVPPTGRR